MTFHRTGHKIEVSLRLPTESQVQMLRRIVAHGKQYGAYYFIDSPLNRFVSWLEGELLIAEEDLRDAALAEESET